MKKIKIPPTEPPKPAAVRDAPGQTVGSKPEVTTSNPITHNPPREHTAGGQRRREEKSSQNITAADLKNQRSTTRGAAADRATRAAVSGDGRVAGHQHSASNNSDLSDRRNVYPQNAAQNIGTKALVEKRRDSTLRQDPTQSLLQESSKIYAPDRPGFGDKVPIAEKVTQTWRRDGKVVGQSSVYFGNFPSSATRHAAEQNAAGRKVDPAVVQALHEKDRENARAQGNGTARQAQENAQRLRAEPGRAEVALVKNADQATAKSSKKARKGPESKREGPSRSR